MQIEGPFTIRVVDNAETQTRELHLSFTDEYQTQDHSTRVQSVRDHVQQLQSQIQAETDPSSLQGMTMILQITEQLLPHIESDEIPLDETIVIEIGPTSPFDNLLSSATLK